MPKLSLDNLLANAEEKTGLNDFGPDDFLPALDTLIADLNRHDAIRQDRIDALRMRFNRLLINRLWFAHDLNKHPEILDEQIKSPVEIVSLPRTGSTKLHRMLAASGDFQFLPMWKTHMFARIPEKPDGGEAERIQEVREYEAWMLEVSPDIRSGHPMFTEEAEEDQWLGECTFRKPMTVIMFDTVEFAGWLMQQDPRPAYAYLRQQLQYLQWQNRQYRGDQEADKPWLLKSPDHFGCEPLLQEIFDDVRFVITHRDPVDCIPSGSTMTQHFRKLYCHNHEAEGLLEPLIQLVSQMANAHLAWRKQATDAPIQDLSFRQVTREGLTTAQQVYDFLDMELTKPSRSGLEQWLADNQRDKHGKNVYSLESVGATAGQIRAAFGGYIERYADFI